MILKIGYKASAEQFSPNDLLKFACLAEDLRFHSVFISDHFQPWRHTAGHAPFSLAWLGALGARTSRIVMGTSVLTPGFRYRPSVVAQCFATLGVMFPDRIVLGLGSGESLNEVAPTGLVWPEMKERFARLREAVALIGRLWSEERVTFDGEFYKTDKATIYDRPTEPVPIYVAAAGPMVAKFAGRVGDGFICTSGKPDTLYRDQLLPNVAAGMEASGRTGNDFDRMIEIKLSFDESRQRAMEDTRLWGALALSQEEKMSVEDPLAMERLSDTLPLERAASRWIVSDDPDDVVEGVRPYVELGFRHLVFHSPAPDQARFLRAFSEKIRPRLHAAFD